MSHSADNPWLHRFAVFTAACTLALIGLGGLVTSHGVGMSVPDWPTTYGYNMFLFPVSKWVGGIFYEHTHRLWASEVGLLTLILMCLLFGRKTRWIIRFLGLALFVSGLFLYWRHQSGVAGMFYGINGVFILGISFGIGGLEISPKWLRRLGAMSFLLVVLQGILGGLRVTEMKDEIGIFHATLAQLFLVLISAIALFTSGWWKRFVNSEPKISLSRGLSGFVLATTTLILLQLVFGATMRHQHAGLAIPDFPLAYGKIWPATDAASIQAYNQMRHDVMDPNPITASHIVVHMTHRITALLIFCCVGFIALKLWKTFGAKTHIARLALIWFGMICAQVVLGIVTVLKNKPADIATAHVVFGAASLVMGSIIAIIARKISVEGKNSIRHVVAASSVKPVSDSKAALTTT